jgi:hypothetical protein
MIVTEVSYGQPIILQTFDQLSPNPAEILNQALLQLLYPVAF